MSNEQLVTKEHFQKRLIALCLRSGLTGFPKDDLDQHILLKSAALSLGKTGVRTEKEVDEGLKNWIERISQIPKLDHGTLRRRMVDTGYLTRDKAGTQYQVAAGLKPQTFAAEVDELNVETVLQDAREEIARRKREYMAKAGK